MRRQYPRYRNSGVEWLGEVPEHWEVQRLKNAASINDQTLSDNEDPLRKVSYVDIGSVHSTDGITMMEKMVFEDAPSRARRLVSDGDTIISTVRTYLRAITPIERPPDDMVVSTGFAVVRPRDLDSRFCSWVLKEYGFVEEVVACSTGVSYPAINAPKLGTFPIPIPPLDEQRAIAAFLDRETKRIDKLVAKYRLLIERLAEYRTALIARTVSQGLPPEDARAAGFNPLPRLKPSGVEWLGYVPEDWEIKRLKIVASINDDKLSDNEDHLREMSYVDIGSIHPIDGITTMEQMVFEDAPSRARRLVRDGDTIVSTVRTYLRAIAPISKPFDDMVVSTGFAVVRPRKLDHGYCSWALREYGFVEEIVACSTGVSYPAINASEMGYFPLPIPPLDEQRAIVAFLDRETGRIDSLSRRVETAIERLQEYRASLITAAVTGKIDVREPVYEEAV